jgi:hypothetical protein
VNKLATTASNLALNFTHLRRSISAMSRKSRKASKTIEPLIPPSHDWRTTDIDEVNKRRFRAQTESFTISNLDGFHPIFSNFRVGSTSGMSYSVEVRDVKERQFACDCVDFRINGLGTCKHVEAVLNHLEARFRRFFRIAEQSGSPRFDVVPDPVANTLRILSNGKPLPRPLREWFDADGAMCCELLEDAVEQLRALKLPDLRLSQEIDPWLAARRFAAERKAMRHEYELKVQSGEWPPQETLVPLFPYQR